MTRIIVFDVNETMLDMQALAPHFMQVFGDKESLKEWFSLLLLHSEAATLAGPYFDFATLAAATLDMIAASRSVSITDSQKEELLGNMLALPPHPEVKDALRLLKQNNFRLVTLSNSSQQAVDKQIQNAGLSEFFERNFSVDTVKRYKPAPETYRMVASELGVRTSDLRLVAAHSWDVMGAMQAGCAAAFVARKGQIPLPLVKAPDVNGDDLRAVAQQIIQHESAKT